MEIKGKTAIITGSSGKLAGTVAITLAEAGANCLCHYNTNIQAANQLVEKIQSLGQTAITLQADLTTQDGIDKLLAGASELENLSILINSASVFEKRPIENIDFASARQTIDLNLISPIVISCQFAEAVRSANPAAKSPAAKIINLVDIAAEKPWAGYAVYCASKAGLAAATKSMAKELAPEFTVNAIAPGLIDLPEDCDEQEKAKQLAMIPASRCGEASEVAAAVKFLIENDYITGQVINIDGGRSV
ncbi:MAG: SDR family oxidoreductase [Anaerohalosphaeraceae bacterium]|nr:SDR family oxidoreductase [Anaerohalosphaeraceae bacterium]